MKIRAILAVLLIMSWPVVGQPARQDAKGAKDFEGIPRFKGAQIIGHQELPFDKFVLPIGPVKENDQFQKVLSDQLNLEGKVSGLVYRLPAGTSTVEVFSNYANALRAAGFTPMFSCEDEACGYPQILAQKVYSGSHIMSQASIRSAQAVMYGDEINYLATWKNEDGKDTYLSLLVGKETAMGGPEKDTVTVVLHRIEPKPMENSMVLVKAEKMDNDLATHGHVALYGIYFDTDSDKLKPESDPTLGEMTKLLSRSDKKVMIVGHTDTQGGFDHNMDLSRRRATAVVEALTKRGIPASKMQPAGVGYLAPVASNRTDDGRAKNRRVELVQAEN